MFVLFLMLGCSSKTDILTTAVTYAPPSMDKNSLLLSKLLPVKRLYLPLQNSRPRIQPITYVVIHFSSLILSDKTDPYNVQAIYNLYSKEGVSAHYLIDRTGQIYCLVPEDRVAFHAGKGRILGYPEYRNKINDYSIGIELLAIGSRQDMSLFMSEKDYETINPSYIGFTDAEYQSLKGLLDNIIKRHPSIIKDRKHVIGHNEYTPNRKTDPGTLFDWSRVISPAVQTK